MSSAPSPEKSNAQNRGLPTADLEKVRDILFGDETRDLRQELHDLRQEFESLREELRRTREDLGKRIEAESAGNEEQIEGVADSVATLRDDKLSREQFAELLSRMASQVRDESAADG